MLSVAPLVRRFLSALAPATHRGRRAVLSVLATAPSICSGPLLPFFERVFADSAYTTERVANANRIIAEIVRKQPASH
jgi:hypothetical protein